MMRNILTIVKKELKRFFTDKRMLMTLVLPGIMIFVLYSVMGNLMANIDTVDKNYVTSVYHVGEMPEKLDIDIQQITKTGDFTVETTKAEADEIPAIKELIEKGEADLLIVIPKDFDINAQSDANLEIYYNSLKSSSSKAFAIYSGVINNYRTNYLFDLNGDINTQYDMATEKDLSGKIFATMLPLLIIMFLFSGCMAVTPESIAGEKERGTIATLLVTPMKRSELAIGKIISLSVVAMVSAISSTVGTILSLPQLMAASGSVSFNYGFMDYLGIFLIIISMVMVIVSAMAIISTFAKSVKEANTLAMPVMIVSTLVGLSSMLFAAPPTNALLYCIPLFSGVQSLSAIMTFDINWLHILLSVGSSLAVTFIFVFILVRMFNNEKIIFNK